METEEPSCKRGRPREFCPDAALDAALSVFWRNGYEGASLTDLTEAMGINRPSLYAAFGNKESLYRRAMDRYGERAAAVFRAALSEPTARQSIERLLRGSADGLTDCKNPAGCFLVVSAMACGPASEAVRAEAATRRMSTGPLLQARFEQAVGDGELPPDADPAALAGFFATVLQGLSVQAASGVDRAGLHRAIDVALRVWPTSPVAPGTPAPAKHKKPR
jgi:AcrR family transcriptional regulator